MGAEESSPEKDKEAVETGGPGGVVERGTKEEGGEPKSADLTCGGGGMGMAVSFGRRE